MRRFAVIALAWCIVQAHRLATGGPRRPKPSPSPRARPASPQARPPEPN